MTDSTYIPNSLYAELLNHYDAIPHEIWKSILENPPNKDKEIQEQTKTLCVCIEMQFLKDDEIIGIHTMDFHSIEFIDGFAEIPIGIETDMNHCNAFRYRQIFEDAKTSQLIPQEWRHRERPKGSVGITITLSYKNRFVN